MRECMRVWPCVCVCVHTDQQISPGVKLDGDSDEDEPGYVAVADMAVRFPVCPPFV